MARKRRNGGEHESHNNSERWMLTYSDMITLLMAFFIMMYSMSVLNLAKFSEVAISIRSGFGGVLKGGDHLLNTPAGEPTIVNINPMGATKTSKEQSEEREEHKRNLKRAQERLISYIIMNELEDQVIVSRESRGLVVTILSDGVLFPAGSAELRTQSNGLLTRIAAVLREVPNHIMVEGHTCDLPISTAVYPSNWELSSARACSVVRFFIAQHIVPRRLSAAGYADTRPRLPNDSAAHRAMNRRVDIVLVSDIEVTNRTRLSRPSARGEQAIEHVKPYLEKVWKVNKAESKP